MGKVLVTGGCGYIGSHTIVDLLNHGLDVISLDNFSNSDAAVLKGIKAITKKTVKNYAVDLKDEAGLRRVFRQHPDITGVIHLPP